MNKTAFEEKSAKEAMLLSSEAVGYLSGGLTISYLEMAEGMMRSRGLVNGEVYEPVFDKR